MGTALESVLAEEIAGVVCFWKWTDSEKAIRLWELVEAVKFFDGYLNGADRWGDTVVDFASKPGRAVTFWEFTCGVQLAAFNPPGDYPKWWSPMQRDHLFRNHKDWWILLEGGLYLHTQTAIEAQKILAAAVEKRGKKRKVRGS